MNLKGPNMSLRGGRTEETSKITMKKEATGNLPFIVIIQTIGKDLDFIKVSISSNWFSSNSIKFLLNMGLQTTWFPALEYNDSPEHEHLYKSGN